MRDNVLVSGLWNAVGAILDHWHGVVAESLDKAEPPESSVWQAMSEDLHEAQGLISTIRGRE